MNKTSLVTSHAKFSNGEVIKSTILSGAIPNPHLSYGKKMIGFLSNVNIEPIKTYFSQEECLFADYGRYMGELLDEASMLYTPEVDKVFLFLCGEELLKDLFYELPDQKLRQEIVGRVDGILEAIKQFLQKRPGLIFVINNIVFPPDTHLTYLDSNSELSFAALESIINERVRDMAQTVPGLLVLDWPRLVKASGYNNLTDDKFWYLGRIRLNNQAFFLLAQEFKGLVRAYQGLSKKVLVLDLDNTLWGGVIGEEGLDGINLSEDGLGKAYRDFQKEVKALRNLGVLLAINSKNNEEDVKEVFDNHLMMVLTYDDFIVKQVNWHNKVKNMQVLSDTLNLGLDSFVFIDDNPIERQAVKTACPEVAVPEFPKDIVQLKGWFLKEVVYPYFSKVYLTQEDLHKTEQYTANLKRNSLSEQFDLEEFIKNLNIKLTLHCDPPSITQRIAQLTQKTNQFNLTTRRYSEHTIKQLIRDKNVRVYGLEYVDKFGKEGIIGAAIVRLNGHTAHIDTFLLSCRVIGRNVEYAFLSRIVETMPANGLARITAEFIPTKKNIVAGSFFKKAGFEEKVPNQFEATVETLIHSLENISQVPGAKR